MALCNQRPWRKYQKGPRIRAGQVPPQRGGGRPVVEVGRVAAGGQGDFSIQGAPDPLRRPEVRVGDHQREVQRDEEDGGDAPEGDLQPPEDDGGDQDEGAGEIPGHGITPRPRDELERGTGIEPASPAWKAGALPLSYPRMGEHNWWAGKDSNLRRHSAS